MDFLPFHREDAPGIGWSKAKRMMRSIKKNRSNGRFFLHISKKSSNFAHKIVQ